MGTAVMFIVMFGLMFLGVPIAVAMFIAMIALIAIDPVTTQSFLAQTAYGGVAVFTNLALPFFMISAGMTFLMMMVIAGCTCRY